MKKTLYFLIVILSVSNLQSQNIEETYKRGVENHKNGNYKAAIIDFNEVLLQDPTDTLAYFERAKTFVCSKKYGKALKDIESAVDNGKTGAELYLLRAEAFDYSFNYSKALENYNQYIALTNEKDVWLYYSKGYTEVKLKLYDDAIKSFTKSIELDTLNNLESSYAFMGRGFAYLKIAEQFKDKPKEAKQFARLAKADYLSARKLKNKAANKFIEKIKKKYGV